ncbi:hypothetical protein LguiB_013599 [Lonicera macranthoides]
MEIRLGYNNLSGTIPWSIYNLSSLTELLLAGNGVGGTLPQNLGLRFPRLKLIELWENRLTGTIPISLSNASDLELIELDNNNFLGKVPTNLGSLERLGYLVMESNSLGRGDADEVNFLSNLSNQLRAFGVADNQMYEEIPLGFGNLANIEILELGNNQFEGQIPYDIGHIKKLNRLYLAKTRVLGRIPLSLGNLSFLSIVYLSNNALEGTIPSSIGKCKYLILLSLSENNLSGTIPKELFSAFALSISLDLTGNYLVGPIPLEVGNLKILVEFDAFENKYLHFPSRPSIVLLDGDMVAHVGDFGLAKFSFPELSVTIQSSSIGIKETIGYAAPDDDRKESYDPFFANGLGLHNYTLNALSDRVMEIVKPKLPSNHWEEVLPAASNSNRNGEESR